VRKASPLILTILAVALAEIAIFGTFFILPIERTLGFSQKIFYFHVPVAWTSFLAFGVTFVAGILFLVKQEKKYDVIGYTSAGLGLLFGVTLMLMGVLWNRTAWGVWWTWDPRLVTYVVLLILFASYFVLRSMVTDESRRARFAAVFGIIAFLDVPITWYSTRLIQNVLHPVVFSTGGMAIELLMLTVLLIALLGVTLLYTSMLILRIRIENINEEIHSIKDQIGR